jgi:hypothetical protein
MMEGHHIETFGRTELVRSATRLVIEEGLEAELPSALACFRGDFEACVAHLRLPVTHSRATRTTNLLERLFLKERRRLRIIPNAFGEKAVLKLTLAAMTRAAERWRAVKITHFERRQMAALRTELDREFEPKWTSTRASQRPNLGPDIQHFADLTLCVRGETIKDCSARCGLRTREDHDARFPTRK